jgi:hypothetical protein
MRILVLVATLTTLAALAATATLPSTVLAQVDASMNASPKFPNGLVSGHALFAGDSPPGLSTTWNTGKNTSFTLRAGGTPPLNSSPPSVSGSVGLTIRF